MIYSIAEAKRHFSDLVKRAAYKGETVTVGSRGKPEAALISVEELRRLRDLELERDARLLEEAVRRSRGAVDIGGLLRAWRGSSPAGVTKVLRGAPKRAASSRVSRKGRA